MSTIQHHSQPCFYRRDALRSLSKVMGDALPIKQKFFDDLYALNSLHLNGSLLLDFSVKASIPKDQVNGTSYGGIDVSILVNRFEAKAAFGSVSPFTISLPLALPGSSEVVSFNLTDASFGVDVFVKTLNPINLTDLFSDDRASTTLSYGGSLTANLPMTVGVAGTNIGIDLTVLDQNLFESNMIGKLDQSYTGLQKVFTNLVHLTKHTTYTCNQQWISL